MKYIRQAAGLLLVLTAVCGGLYPLAVTGTAQSLFPSQANGSIIYINNVPVGSRLIGQEFTADRYFSGRPSASGYDGLRSGGTNWGAASRELKEAAEQTAAQFRERNGLGADDSVPAEAVTRSASGLDPHTSPQAVYAQVKRVAAARHMDEAALYQLISRHTEPETLGIIGQARVNVLELNIALDALQLDNEQR